MLCKLFPVIFYIAVQFYPTMALQFSAKAGSSSNVTNRDKQWLSRFLDWKTPELKLPKLPRAVFSKKSKKGKGIEIEIVPKTEPIPGHSSEVNNLPPPAPPDNVTDSESSLAPSAPIFNDSPPVFDFFPLDLKFKPSLPSISERHSSSSSDYGHSYRSRSSSGPSVYRGSDPSFPYPLLYESKKPNDHRSLKRQSSGSPSSISPPIPEANRPPSTERGPSALGVDQVQAQHNTILERFVKLGDWEEGGAQSLSVPDKKDNGSPMVEAKGRSAGSGYVGSPSTPNGSNNANVNVAPGTATSAAVGARAAAQDKQSLLANEKRRRRRKSHNAVERRRRDNINEKTSELAMLIPECMLDATASGTGGGSLSSFFPFSSLFLIS
jgi:hypothetical protein